MTMMLSSPSINHNQILHYSNIDEVTHRKYRGTVPSPPIISHPSIIYYPSPPIIHHQSIYHPSLHQSSIYHHHLSPIYHLLSIYTIAYSDSPYVSGYCTIAPNHPSSIHLSIIHHLSITIYHLSIIYHNYSFIIYHPSSYSIL